MKKYPQIMIPLFLSTALLLLSIYLIIAQTFSNHMPGVPYVLLGISFGAISMFLSKLFEKRQAEKDPKLARTKSIEETDERNQMIITLAKAKTYDFTFWILSILVLFYAAIGSEIKIVIPIIVVYVMILAYHFYWSCRYYKEY